ncbi:MAG TPA: methylated-DNA--[protein]-cysteine S-methyltransferase [Candidatus Limnocylindria bacterium]|nr:methylated-DNA--[protein]-cysteine S-methyltransferase [Candidatus Limnocylindria bacterium]
MPEPLAIGSIETAWGPMQLATTPRGILLIERGDDPAPLLAAAQRRLPRSALDGAVPDHLAWLAGWIAGQRRDLAPIDLRGLSDFDAVVYRAVREIGWGDRATYGDLAVAIGRPGAARAVGGAMARCPVFPAVPCHRVVRATDGWSGWGSSGDVRKRALLDREGR